MRESIISNCEKSFILKGITEGKRLDGRRTYDFRKLGIQFGNERGLCEVHLGSTKVLVQVSCEVVTPAVSRPNEGVLKVNADLTSLSAPHFDTRPTELSMEINRLLERCILESRAVDVETLCIVAREKVWSVRVDARVLNHDGNLVDCLSIAVITALIHFRRPDVTVSGEEVTVHTLEDRNPVPLSIHHWPICITFAFFDDGKYLLLDPTEREEQTMNGKAVLGVNGLKEICTWHMSSTMSLHKDQILRCAQIATSKATEIIDMIKSSLALDAAKRKSGKTNGFLDLMESTKITSALQEPVEIDTQGIEDSVEIVEKYKDTSIKSNEVPVITKGIGTAAIGLGGASTWTISDDDDVVEMKSETTVIKPEPKTEPKIETDLSDDSEEETVVLITGDD